MIRRLQKLLVLVAAMITVAGTLRAQPVDTRMTRPQVSSILAATQSVIDKRSIRVDSFAWGGFYGSLVVQFDRGLTSNLISWNADGDRTRDYTQCLPLLAGNNGIHVGTLNTPVDDPTSWSISGINNGTRWRLTFLKQSARISYVASLLE